jgi:cell division protein FtsB
MIAIGLAAVAIWTSYSFAQEAYLSHRLSQDALRIRQQNQALQAQNDSYRKDIAVLTSGQGKEEDSRLHGYIRPGEAQYIVSRPQPVPSPARPPATVRVEAQQGSLLDSIWRWMANLGHR